jgi:protein TonB
MSLAITSQDEESPVAVNTGDRLGFTLFLALAIHAMLILGITFKLPEPSTASQTIEITLATHKSARAPEDADFLAQYNQEGSGTEDTARQITTEHLADFADTRIQEVNPMPVVAAVSEQVLQDQRIITTVGKSDLRATLPEDADSRQHEEAREGDLLEQPLLSNEIASLQAKLDRQRQEYAKRPRTRTLTSVSTRESHDARYLHEWSTRVEQTGNQHYPPEALSRGLTGNLRLSVVINPDGTLHAIDILQSSGHRVLDDAARRIVRLASPFPPFPPEIRQHTDRLNIIRTWNFEINGLSTSAR